MASFIPRTVFELPASLPRSYFLGHHKAGLDKMKTLLSQIDLVIECRDYRVPVTGRNPEFERVLGLGSGQRRLIVYTKQDLGRADRGQRNKHESMLARRDAPDVVHFTSLSSGPNPAKDSVNRVLDSLRQFARERFSLTGHRVLIAGMPNVGKSTLLNALRRKGISADQRSSAKVAQTGADPGVTRSIGNAVKIIPAEGVDSSTSASGPRAAVSGAVYMLDTPGVFMPYVPDAHAMLKLALCGAVKDTIIAPETVADYLLYHINANQQESVYEDFSPPTNDILSLLERVATRTGQIGKGGKPELEAAALWLIKRWRSGKLGRFILDDLNESRVEQNADVTISWSQALRKDKLRRQEKAREKPM